jgi:hypothetical protein
MLTRGLQLPLVFYCITCRLLGCIRCIQRTSGLRKGFQIAHNGRESVDPHRHRLSVMIRVSRGFLSMFQRFMIPSDNSSHLCPSHLAGHDRLQRCTVAAIKAWSIDVEKGGLQKARSDDERSGTGSHRPFWLYGVGRAVNRTSPSVFRRLCLFHEHGERAYTISSALEL